MFIDCKTEKEWLARRINFLTASDAGNYCGLNPYDKNGRLTLWEEKVGLRKRPDLSGKAAVQFGKKAEDHVRELFLLMHPEFTLQYDKFGLYVSDDHPYMAATLDGLLLNQENATHEILECKTATVRTADALREWTSGNLPINYWCQILHQSECVKWATGVWVVALVFPEWKLELNPGESLFLTFHFDVKDPEFISDRIEVVNHATEMWQMITSRRRPSVPVAL